MVTSFQFFISYLIVDVLCIALTIIIASKVSRDSGSETQVRYFFLVLTSYFAFTILDAVHRDCNRGGHPSIPPRHLAHRQAHELIAQADAMMYSRKRIEK